ncbi:MAG TPA: dienelactone hydrolase family protein [Pseudonocardiaceae bacterium]|nr:dienelactone hydrolase family protein [Pseudonocardiaceae bacterium]
MAATRVVSYRDLDTPLTGEFYRHDERVRPGILVIHGGAGLDDHARQQARRYAALGYHVLACDMYGDGVAGDRERVVACVTGLRDDPASLVRRGQAGLTALADRPEVEGALAVVGFCFGGMAALALARAGAAVAGVVSMHGSLATSAPAGPGAVTAKVLVCHGALDPHVPMTDVTAFVDEMIQAGADWQLAVYGNAMHGFTHDGAPPMPGVAHEPLADRRSFATASSFLAEQLRHHV